MTILSHLSDWPVARFDYEQLLAHYRSRIPREQGEEIQQRIAADKRWQAHWDSIRYLDARRDYARQSAEQLAAFDAQQAGEACRLVAASGGEVLWPIVDETSGPLNRLLGSSENPFEHLDACVYCRLMADDLRSELARHNSGLPPGELTLRDWLLDHYVRARLEALTRQLLPSRSECLQEVERLEGKLTVSPEATQHFLQSGKVIAAGTDIERNVAADAHYFIAAGANDVGDSSHNCTPVWYTKLFAPPTQLKWIADGGEHEYDLQLRPAGGQPLIHVQLKDSEYHLSPEDQASIPTDRPIKWLVSDAGKSLFSGVFVIVGDEVREQIRSQLSLERAPTLVNRLSLATLLWDHELFDAAIEILRDLQRRFVHGAPGFVVHRLLAGTWRSVREELSDRRMDLPEGAWANEHVTRALEAAFQALPED